MANAEYITNGMVLKHEGKMYPDGSRVTMDEELAKKFGGRLTLAEVAAPDKPLEEKTVKELRALAKTANVADYWNKDKAALVSELKAVGNDESNSG